MAKIASDWRKPDGLTVVSAQQVDDFVARLPVAKLHGVGKETAKKLRAMGVSHCADLRVYSEEYLQARCGSFGSRLYQLCRGIDQRPVRAERERKSLSVEHTFARDLDRQQALAELPQLFARLQLRSAADQALLQTGGAFVKVKFSDFSQTTLSDNNSSPSVENYMLLLSEAMARKSLPIRLVGIGVRLQEERDSAAIEQLGLF